MKALFTNSVGANLRNEVAHGLLNDNAAYSYAPIYAWWMLMLNDGPLYNFVFQRE
ncbi:DUF4209 domain-containing protein [Photobacterium leiognathi]|uniref:DUF4209 domain-containing protein n=1 Tax=Photobacterium leiognathi TaxID=553611 RepID=UPI0034E948AE